MILWIGLLLGCGESAAKPLAASPLDLVPVDGAAPGKGPSIPGVPAGSTHPGQSNSDLDGGADAGDAAIDAGDAALGDASSELDANFYWDATLP
jgi:hypothetical protein